MNSFLLSLFQVMMEITIVTIVYHRTEYIKNYCLLSHHRGKLIHLKVCFYFPCLGADTLLTKLVDKIGATSSHGRLIVAHMPLIMVCLEGVGKLAEKFPMLAKQVC